MPDLRGARIGLLEARLSGEMAELVRRYGGEPVSAPAVREEPIAAGPEVAAFIDALSAQSLPFVLALTGVGVTALIREAEALGREQELLTCLRHTITICRGPKPAGVLTRYDVPIGVRVPSPHTTTDVIGAIDALDLAGRGVGLLNYGERNEPLTEALRERGAIVHELCLYEWQLPLDVQPLRALVQGIVSGSIDAVAFTSQIQLRHLLQIAEEDGLRDALVTALNGPVAVAAIGPTCAAALIAADITPRVVPDPPKLIPMLSGLADWLASSSGGTARQSS